MKKIICIITIMAMLLIGSSVVYAHSGLILTVENANLCNISEPVDVTVTLTDNCDKVQFYVEGILVDEKTGLITGANELTIDISKTPVLGETNLVAQTVCSTPSEASAAVTLVKLKAVETILTEDFENYTDSSKSPGEFTANNGGKGYGVFAPEITDGGIAAKVTVNQQGEAWNAPYFEKSSIGISTGSIFTIETDFYATHIDSQLAIEARNFASGYPMDGSSNAATIYLFAKGGKMGTWGNPYYGKTWSINTWYRVKMVFNSVTKGYDMYYKLRDAADSEYVQADSRPNILCTGLSKMRFTCYSQNDSSDMLFDNVLVKCQQSDDLLYMSTAYEDSGVSCNADEFPVTGGTVKVAFSKAVTDSKTMVSIKNDLDDKIACTAFYNESTNIFTLSPIEELNYDSKYSVCFEGTTADSALNPVPRVFNTKKSDNRVVNYVISGTTLSVNVTRDASGTEYTMLAVYIKDGGVVSVNAVKVNYSGAYSLTMLNEPYDSVEFYVIDSLESIGLLNK